MSILRAHLAQRAFNTPLMIHPGKAVAGLAALGMRIVAGGVTVEGGPEAIVHRAGEHPLAGRVGDQLGAAYDREGRDPFPVIEGIAVIPIEGMLVHKGGYVGMSSGVTSYEGLMTQIVRAGRNPAVRGVVLEVDSYGGEVAGAFETARMIRRLAAEKPMLAILTDNAMSAAYLLASQAAQIVMPPTGGAGSIGVITLHWDQSAMLADHGIKVTVLFAGAHKADGNPFEALPEPVATRVREELEMSRRLIAMEIGAGRGARFSAEAAMATEAQDFRGDHAVQLGLADAIGDANEAFTAFVTAINRGGTSI